MVRSPVRVAPVVLAGGRSSRMGRDKAQLALRGGETFLQRALRLLGGLQAAGIEFLPPLISGARPGGIPDLVSGRGPLGGLHAVAEHLGGTNCAALLAIPVDMPLLAAEQLQQLCREGLGRDGRALCFGEHYLPLWLPLADSSRDYLRAAVAGGRPASIRGLLSHLNFERLPAPGGDWHCNINRPQEFSAFEAGLAPT